MFGFEKLEVWQKALEFTGHIYDATKLFPKKEQFGLISQLQRAAVSICANIAEGLGVATKRISFILLVSHTALSVK